MQSDAVKGSPAGPAAAPAASPEYRAWAVARVKSLIDGDEILADLWIEGEISDFKQASSGHCYYTLKDSQSELRCVMWRNQAWRLSWRPQQGDAVEAHGYVSVYERGGVYQFYTDTLLKGGVGDRWREFQALKTRLEAEGLFAASRKRPLPRWPERIGVVTSPSGAALQDILNVLRHRYPLVEVVISPTLVQGLEAPVTIVRALDALNALPDIDVVILARGGGSVEDLWAFNDEAVARAIVRSRAPVITGVGHETDFTIADFCADLRAPTPSAAAAAAVPDRQELQVQLLAHIERLTELALAQIDQRRERVGRLWERLRRQDPRRGLAESRQRVDELLERGRRALRQALRLQRVRLEGCRARLGALDARIVLQRGYAIVQNRASGQCVRSVHEVTEGNVVDILVHDGRMGAQILDKEPYGIGRPGSCASLEAPSP
ncbi:MAG: exodeoxyribonuclease VII large subunit [Chloroflexi bacterium]|nr:exodeoxyribonuclease VII large subunit [Chloroflexota bacterium]